VFAYVSGAVEDNVAYRDKPRRSTSTASCRASSTDVSRAQHRATLFGREYAMPVGIAPMGIAALAAYRGDLVLARAAKRGAHSRW
jgi:L-lactate dehydrogenase (cytochrome)